MDLKTLNILIEYLNNLQDVYENIEEFNPRRKWSLLIVFDDLIADMISNRKFSPIVTEIFSRRRKLNISTVFITESYCQVPKDVKLNSTHFLR